MAKHAQQNRLSRQNNGSTTLEQNTMVDDSLLPPAEELEKLEQVSPGVIEWIKSRTEIEQDARIRFNDNRVKLANKDLTSTHGYNFISLICAFVIIISAMGFSYVLIKNNLHIEGTVFAGGTIIIAATYFLRIPTKKPTNNHK